MNEPWAQRGRRVLQRLTDHGHEAYFVGGCVRDHLMGRVIHDVDIATSALPDQVIALFPRTVPTGLRHGTVTVLWEDEAFEVTTFRTESEYEDHRRPAHVAFVSDLETDLMRRDFTMNAMAMDADGRLIDPFGGRADIDLKRVRCVGEPRHRFEEDALRMLRCLRFASEYGFAIDPPTWSALRELAPLMQAIAMERVRAELERIVEGSHPRHGLRLWGESGLIPWLKRDLGIHASQWRDAAEHPGTERLTEVPDAESKWAFLFLAMEARSPLVKEALTRLTFSGQKEKRVTAIVDFHRLVREKAMSREPAETAWKECILQYGTETARLWTRLLLTVCPELAADGEYFAWARAFLDQGEEWIREMGAVSLQDLQITGAELIEAGVAKGPKLGRTLQALLRAAALGHVANAKDKLLAEAKRIADKGENE